MRGTIVCLTIVLAALLACKSKSTGTVTVDGAPFTIKTCRSGEANIPKFDGVDFLDESGRRVRFLLQSTGQIRTFFFAPNATQGELVGENCGTLSVTRQNSTINNVTNVKGSVSANCTGAGHVIVATATFEGCH
ncbi:MAG: hypothetical protein KC776_43000 [Myxococcales bacterium]|nr:hypothetical protein [Myxococcales bacterium]MCB9576138.1 hypothetical protein [Polyangiaceae bacterium]